MRRRHAEPALRAGAERLRPGPRGALLALLLCVCGAAAQPAGEIVVRCLPASGEAGQCSVSPNVYVGWRVFHSVCNHCHGQDARGGSFAPDLLARMRSLSYAQFREITEAGVTGRVGVMPGYRDNPNVARWLDQLYSYLRARADGRLPAGRPQRSPEPG